MSNTSQTFPSLTSASLTTNRPQQAKQVLAKLLSIERPELCPFLPVLLFSLLLLLPLLLFLLFLFLLPPWLCALLLLAAACLALQAATWQWKPNCRF